MTTLSIGLANYGSTYALGEWNRFVDLGRAADDAGVDRIIVVDHVVMGPHTENYAWGKFPVPPDRRRARYGFIHYPNLSPAVRPRAHTCCLNCSGHS